MFEAYSPIWGLFFLAISIAVLCTKPFASANLAGADLRVHRLDGLRGILALAVVLHHSSIFRLYLIEGKWKLPPSDFYAEVGPIAVQLFFMITAFLFWRMVVERSGRMDFPSLLLGRVFRIGPVFLAAVAISFVVLFALDPGTGVMGGTQLISNLLRNLTLGMMGYSPMSASPQAKYILAGVTWTLPYEWMFYFALPGLAVAVRLWPRQHALIACACVFIARVWYLLNASQLNYAILLFSVGMLIASIDLLNMSLRVPRTLLSAGAAFVTVLVFTSPWLTFPGDKIVLLAILLYLINSGADLFGVLTSRPFLYAGEMSYSIYLLHGIALNIVLVTCRQFAVSTPEAFWSLVYTSLFGLLFFALAVHGAIERPGYRLGQRLRRHLATTG